MVIFSAGCSVHASINHNICARTNIRTTGKKELWFCWMYFCLRLFIRTVALSMSLTMNNICFTIINNCYNNEKLEHKQQHCGVYCMSSNNIIIDWWDRERSESSISMNDSIQMSFTSTTFSIDRGHIKVRHMCMTSKTYMNLIKWTLSCSTFLPARWPIKMFDFNIAIPEHLRSPLNNSTNFICYFYGMTITIIDYFHSWWLVVRCR